MVEPSDKSSKQVRSLIEVVNRLAQIQQVLQSTVHDIVNSETYLDDDKNPQIQNRVRDVINARTTQIIEQLGPAITESCVSLNVVAGKVRRKVMRSKYRSTPSFRRTPK